MPSLPNPNYAHYNAIADAQIVTVIDNDGSVFTSLSSSVGMMPSNNPNLSTTTANKKQFSGDYKFFTGKIKYLQEGI